ncbi:MAG: transglutaminase family protein [Phycisphaeraceae bacterium]|nr:MAG: transglutaminase family protein [Phycisphaeraceae bacterium]
MFIRILHALRYTYERPVFLEPMTVRMTPRNDVAQRVLRHTMHIEPEAQGCTWTIEPDGTDARSIWFLEEQDRLVIRCDSIVETLRANPFDGILTYAEASTLPASYPEALRPVLEACRAGTIHPEVGDWAAELASEVDRDSMRFVLHLNDAMYNSMRVIERRDGDPYTPEQTLEEGSGACRDVAMLYVAACRSQGLAARFVSGYSTHHPPEVTQHELHAWAEVYLPGCGWRGYDPSLGLAVADGHVALATGPDHRLSAPLTGSYRGTGVGSKLEYDIVLTSAPTIEALGVVQHDTP